MRFLIFVVCALAPLAPPPQGGRNQTPDTNKTTQQGNREVPQPRGSFTTINGAVGEPNKDTAKNNTESKDHRMLLLNTIATVAMAVFALFSVLIYWAQLRALKINERAWVVPIIHAIEKTPDPEQFQITVDLQNNGKTPHGLRRRARRDKERRPKNHYPSRLHTMI